jgi:UDP-2,4-diacetamido-2,4,6-trideoxy-beta-L-altropyranose hydrolase
MVSPRIIFRADASSSIGSGHVMRCLALAERLAARGAEVLFASLVLDGDLIAETERRGYKVLHLSLPFGGLGPTEAADADAFVAAIEQLAPIEGQRRADWIIVDHYHLGAPWQRRIWSQTAGMMAIDDLANRQHVVDVLLDQNLVQDLESRYVPLVGSDCLTLLGPRFALLAQNYASLRPMVRRNDTTPPNILVYFGGADTRLAVLTAEVLTHLTHAFSATIVLDEANRQYQAVSALAASDQRLKLTGRLPDLAAAMLASSLFVGASGTTSWERLCLGLYAIVVTLADNQVPLARELSRRDLINWLGDGSVVTAESLANSITNAITKPVDPERMQTMMDVVDGLGAERVCDVLLHDRRNEIVMRRARPEDSDLVLSWANDTGTRRYAFSTDAISLDVHTGWFAKRIANADVVFLIAETPSSVALGQVRFERQANGQWEISYLIAPFFRGRGLAQKVLSAAIDKLTEWHREPIVTGLVKAENIASMRVFSALGFVRASNCERDGATRFVLDPTQYH